MRSEFGRGGATLLDRRYGPADGPPVVLVHGIGVGCSYFDRLVPLLAVHGTVHVVELPGFGDAPRPSWTLTVEEHALLLAAFLAALPGPAVLIGHSMGAQVVVQAAADAPAAARAIVLIGAVTDPEERSAPMQALRLAQDVLGEPPATNWAVLSEYAKSGPRRYLATLPSMLEHPTEAVARTVRVPALVLRGSRDPICRLPWARRLAAALPQGRLVQVPRARHVVMHTHPRAVASAVLAHLPPPAVP